MLDFSNSQGTVQPQYLYVSSSSGSLAFTAAVNAAAEGVFGVSPATGEAFVGSPTPVQVFIQPGQNLGAGSYTGQVTIASGAQSQIITLRYTVGSASQITPQSGTLNFAAAVGSQPTSQTDILTTTASATGLTVTASVTTPVGGSWLGATLGSTVISSSASDTLTVAVTPGALQAGNYTGTVNVFAGGSNAPAVTIFVNLALSSTGIGGITVSPSSLTYNFATGASTTSAQSLKVTNSSNLNASVSATALMNQDSADMWLSVSQGVNIIAGSANYFTVTVNPIGLAAATYTGVVNLSVSGEATPIPIAVTVNIGTNGASELTVSPATATTTGLVFNIPAGSTGQVTAQTLTVSTTNHATVNFAATQSTSLGTWLTVNPAGLQTVSLNTTITLTVNVDPAGLVSGIYTGTIALTPQDGSPGLSIPVTVNVGTAPEIIVSPSALSFAYQTGTAFPPAQSLLLTSSGDALAFSVTPTQAMGGDWLVVSPLNGQTNPAGGSAVPINVQVNAGGLAVNTYNGNITITSAGASNSPQTIPVTLLVSNLPILTLGTQSVSFNYEFDTTTFPAQQQVALASSGNPLTFTTSITPGPIGGNWLTVTPSTGTTSATLILGVAPSVVQGLAAGTYTSTVTISAPSAGNPTVTLPVTLVIATNILLAPSQTSLLFNYEIGKAVPATQTFSLASNGSPVQYTVSTASTNCGQFLSATSSSTITPGTVAVAINASGITAGTCKGTVTVTSSTANVGNSPLTIPVTLIASNSPLLNVSPAVVNVSATVGASPATQTISLTSTDSTVALGFNVTSTTSTGTGWLLVGPTSGSTPNNLTLGFQTAGLAIGTYTGSVTVTPTAAGSLPTVIPVTVVISSGATASAAPAMLTFAQPYLGAAPAAQAVQIVSSTAGLSFSASATTFNGGQWLTVTPLNSTTPVALMVSVNGSNLGQGSYSGVVTVVMPGASNAPLYINVTLTVGPASTLAVSPANLSFTYTAGGTPPVAQTVQVTNTTGTAVPFAATAASSNTGLVTVTPTSGTTPGTLSIAFAPSVLSNLGAGSYTGTVTVTSSSFPGTSLAINVSLTVLPQPTPVLTTVVNAASALPGAVSPGEIISIYGTNIGPATPQGLQLTSAGLVSTTLSETQVTFDGILSPLIYVSEGQINAIVPYEIAGRATTNVAVQLNGVASTALTLNVADTAPAIFSLSQGGNGQGAILNFNGSVNGSANPAGAGTVIAMFGTGEGMLDPSGVTGGVTSLLPPFPVPAASPITVTIGGLPATITYAGEAPGLVSGVLQIDAVIPAGVGSGPQAIVLTVGNATNKQQSITVFVQ